MWAFERLAFLRFSTVFATDDLLLLESTSQSILRSLKEVSLLLLQTDVETRAEGQTRALPPSWAR